MHKLGCPQRNSPYAHCECDAMDMREHTEQLRRYNETAPTAELVAQLQAEIAELREQLAAQTANVVFSDPAAETFQQNSKQK